MRARLSAWWPWRANHQHNPPMVERRRVIGTQKNQPPQGLACLRFCKESHTAKKVVAEPATAAASRLAPGISLRPDTGSLRGYRAGADQNHTERNKQSCPYHHGSPPSACSVILTNRGANFVAHSAHTSTNLTRFSWIATRTKPPAVVPK